MHRDLSDRVSGTVCCTVLFAAHHPNCVRFAISVDVRHGIRMLSVSTFRTCAGRYGTDEEPGTRQATEVGQWEKASSDTIVSLLRLRDSQNCVGSYVVGNDDDS